MARRIVVGLGNPGRRYTETRHNAGFLVIDELARRWGIDCSKKQLGSEIGTGQVRDVQVVLVKPQQFMNRSGHPTRSLIGFYKATQEETVIVHDEVDLPFGTVRVKQGGGAGGHNGLKDLNRHLDSGDYTRVRVGVSRPPEGWDTADYVLGKWNAEERSRLENTVAQAADAVEEILHEGPTAAMNKFNIRSKQQKAADQSLDVATEEEPEDQAPTSSRLSIQLQALVASGA